MFDANPSRLRPTPSGPPEPYLIEIAQAKFEATILKARLFHEGAQFYDTRGRFDIASFMLHQSMEQALRCFYVSVIEHNIQGHNLWMLWSMMKPFALRLKTVFNFKKEEDKAMFDFLSNSYIISRYSFSICVNQKRVHPLIDAVAQVIDIAARLCQSFIKSNCGTAVNSKIKDSMLYLDCQ